MEKDKYKLFILSKVAVCQNNPFECFLLLCSWYLRKLRMNALQNLMKQLKERNKKVQVPGNINIINYCV